MAKGLSWRAAVAALSLVMGAGVAIAKPPFEDVDTVPWVTEGYKEVSIQPQIETEIRRIVDDGIIGPLSRSVGSRELMESGIGLFDVDGDGVEELFIQVFDEGQCGDGCRTLIYRHVGTTWKNVFDGMSVAIMVRPGSFSLLRLYHPPRVFTWDNDSRVFIERGAAQGVKQAAQ